MYVLDGLYLLIVCVQRVADVPSEFAENQSWGVPEQAFAEEGKYSLTYVLFTLITQSRAQFDCSY